MHFILQENLFQERHYQMLIEIMEKFNLSHQIVKVVPFVDELESYDSSLIKDSEKVFCFGSVKLARIANKFGWNPGSYYNDNHDYRIYAEKYGLENMLNGDSKIYKFSDKFEIPGPSSLFFARPCEDLKSFTGGVFMRNSWDEFVSHSLTNGHTTTLNENTPIQVASLKDIKREIRCWIINNKVVTASQYRINERTIYQECTEPYIIEWVEKMSNLYSPADMYVMDVALIEDDIKIIEINCINAAGFYDSNLQKLILEIINYLDHK